MTLGIDSSLFGEDSEKFFLDDPFLYLNFHDGNGEVGIGFLEAEKRFKQVVNYAMFKTGIPMTEVRRDPIEQEFTLEGVIKQFQKETIALATQRSIDTTDVLYDRVIIASEIPAPIFPSAVLVGKTVDTGELRLWIRRLQITAEDLEILMGGSEYSGIPFKGTAQRDTAPQTTNPLWPYSGKDGDDIAFWSWLKADPST